MGRAAKLKALRRVAEKSTVGLPPVAYGDVQRVKLVMVRGEPTKVARAQRVMVSKCTRRVYKALKRVNPAGSMRRRRNADKTP